MDVYDYSSLSAEQLESLCKRGAIDFSKTLAIVNQIEERVLHKRDAALIELADELDRAKINTVTVSSEEFDECDSLVTEDLKTAIRAAAKNITRFHEQQKCSIVKVETTPGVTCWQEFRPIERVGLYIPGGSAPLFSTLLMLAIPAKVAGCSNLVICTPPGSDGKVAPEILWTAKFLGIKQLFKAGGAQAIFAMSHGTPSIPKVDKIFGPGNRFVMAAKMAVQSRTAIDMPAGPSEVLVIADNNANPAVVASDLLSQAEHGADSQSVLVCLSAAFAEAVRQHLERQLSQLPRRETATTSLQNSFVLICKNLQQAFVFSNRYAPEHLILQLDNWEAMLTNIQSAGSVFCGAFAPESAGDYASGTNHTLPTGGFAKSFSGLSLQSFGKMITFQHLSETGLKNLASTVIKLAEAEGLHGHARAISIRFDTK